MSKPGPWDDVMARAKAALDAGKARLTPEPKLLREMLAERCETCREGEMPYLWRCPAGVEGWTEGWHHAENDCDGWDDGNLCDASDLIDQHDPDGMILGGEVYDTACVCACHAGWASFGEDRGECQRCGTAPDDYSADHGLTVSQDDCAFGHAVRRARTAEAEVAPLVALLRRVEEELSSLHFHIGPMPGSEATFVHKCNRCVLADDIRAALQAHEEGR